MMNLGLVSAILPDQTFEEVIDYAAGVGFGCVEVCCWPVGKALRRYAGVTHIDINGLTDEKMRYYLDFNQEAVAKRLGISQVQVSRLEKKIIQKLKTRLVEDE